MKLYKAAAVGIVIVLASVGSALPILQVTTSTATTNTSVNVPYKGQSKDEVTFNELNQGKKRTTDQAVNQSEMTFDEFNNAGRQTRNTSGSTTGGSTSSYGSYTGGSTTSTSPTPLTNPATTPATTLPPPPTQPGGLDQNQFLAQCAATQGKYSLWCPVGRPSQPRINFNLPWQIPTLPRLELPTFSQPSFPPLFGF